MGFIEYEHVVEALSSDGADQSLDERVLPGGFGTDDDLLDAHAFHTLSETRVEVAVSISKEIVRGRVPWECLTNLEDEPLRVRMIGDVEVKDSSSVMAEDNEDGEDAEEDGVNGEHVDGNHGGHVVSEEGDPRMEGRLLWCAMKAFQVS